jgi:hypothetical protein
VLEIQFSKSQVVENFTETTILSSVSAIWPYFHPSVILWVIAKVKFLLGIKLQSVFGVSQLIGGPFFGWIQSVVQATVPLIGGSSGSSHVST